MLLCCFSEELIQGVGKATWFPQGQVRAEKEPMIILGHKPCPGHLCLLLSLCVGFIHLTLSLGGIPTFLSLSHVRSLLTIFASVFYRFGLIPILFLYLFEHNNL